jgi:FtsP/CotA-like multicopper oxidase with cupredoxin domain
METFDMTWVPSEPGRWLYHCHRIPHMRLPVPLDPGDAAPAENHDHEHMHDMNSDYAGMGGMIIGMTIRGRSAIDTTTNWKPTRKLELSVGTQTANSHLYSLALKDLAPAPGVAKEKPLLSTGLTGPPIVITEKEPVEIEIVNRMAEPTAIHWHGMELESYYDGVPGWGGRDEKKTPAVEPGKSFTVRMIPPRAGTFMYHTHWHDEVQLTGGIHGALVVMPRGQVWNPATDKVFMMTLSPNDTFGAGLILMNGSPQPATMRLQTGVTYRFRFVNITPTMDAMRISLTQAGQPVQWRQIAKDAADLRTPITKPADQMIAVGETYDFEYKAESPRELSLVGLNPGDNRRAVQTLVFTAPQ